MSTDGQRHAIELAAELAELRAQRKELLEALKVARNWVVLGRCPLGWNASRLDDVIAKVTP